MCRDHHLHLRTRSKRCLNMYTTYDCYREPLKIIHHTYVGTYLGGLVDYINYINIELSICLTEYIKYLIRLLDCWQHC